MIEPFYATQTYTPCLWQSDQWEQFQHTAGNKTFLFQNGDAKALVIQKAPHKLKFWKKALWEIPRGPVGKKEDISDLLGDIFCAAKKQGIASVRVYPPFGNEHFWDDFDDILSQWQHHDAPEIFPEHTLFLDLSQTEEEILAQMKPKGRYNIRLATKKGVYVQEEKNTNAFWKLMEQTSTRDGFTSNKKKVYDAMLTSFGDDAILLSAFDDTGEILASSIFVVSGDMAVYYYGASSNTKRNLMAPYLLQWKAIQWAQKKGAKTYDFLGICPEGKKDHQLSSVAQFKLKFGGHRSICARGIEFQTA